MNMSDMRSEAESLHSHYIAIQITGQQSQNQIEAGWVRKRKELIKRKKVPTGC